jgi:hypothetical protein
VLQSLQPTLEKKRKEKQEEKEKKEVRARLGSGKTKESSTTLHTLPAHPLRCVEVSDTSSQQAWRVANERKHTIFTGKSPSKTLWSR